METLLEKIAVDRPDRAPAPKHYAIAGQLLGTDWVVSGDVDRIRRIEHRKSSEMGYSYSTLNIIWMNSDRTHMTVNQFTNAIKGYHDAYEVEPADPVAEELERVIEEEDSL